MAQINETFDIIQKYDAPIKFTSSQIKLYNEQAKTSKILLVFKNTKGLKTEDLEKLDDNIVISIQGGLDPGKKKKFDDIYYKKRTYYTPKELVAIIKIFESIESKINPKWSELEKAKFIYQELYKCLEYDDLELKWNRTPTENYSDWAKQREAKNGKKITEVKPIVEPLVITRDSVHNLLGLITGGAVCAGFALIYKEAMDRIGIKCHYQNKRSGHCWNILEINGIYYGVDLSDELGLKRKTYPPNNECPFKMFGTQERLTFYHTWHENHRSLEKEDPKEEPEYELSVIGKLYIVAGHKITIKNNIPITDDPLITYVRDDKTVFMLIPVCKYEDSLYEYLYIEYDPESKQMNTSKIYSETYIQTYNIEIRDAIANKLLSKSRVDYMIQNNGGYVGGIRNNKVFTTYENTRKTSKR